MGNKIPLIFPAVLAGGAAVPWYLAGGVARVNCIGAYAAVGAADLAASYVNLANPGTYDLTAPTAAPDFNTGTGWTFNGSSQYLATGITPADARTWTVIIKFSNVAGQTGFMFGYYPLPSSGYGWLFGPNRATNIHRYFSGNTALDKAGAVTNGVMAIAGATAYLDSVSEGTITLGATNGEVYLGANKSNTGTPPVYSYCACKIQAAAFYNTVLTEAQVGAVTAAMSPFSEVDYSLVFIPDSGAYINDATKMADLADWIVANKDKYFVRAVLHGGDLTNAVEAEWAKADAFYDALDAVNLPYLATSGNHDGDNENPPTRGAMVQWNNIFPQSRYTSKSWWNGGFFETGQSQNAYLIIGDTLFLTFEHAPRQVVLDWAGTIAAANPTKRIVMTTHAMEHCTGERFSTDGDASDASDYYASDTHDGDLIWNDLCKLYSNFYLLMSGHFTVDNTISRHVATGDNSNKVESIFTNFQVPAPWNPKFRLVSFIKNTNVLWLRTYDPTAEAWDTSASAEYFVDLS